MDQTLTCPTCSKQLRVPPAMAGKHCKCPGCGTRMACPPEPTPADPLAGWDEFFEESRKVETPPLIDPTTIGKRMQTPKRTALISARKLPTCRDCGHEVSSSAKRCPNCGCSNPSTPQWLMATVACLFLMPFVLIGGCVILAVATGEKPKPTATAADVSPAAQAERKALIEKLIGRGIFQKVDRPGTIPQVWITPTYRLLNYDDKVTFIEVAFVYFFPTIETYGEHVRLKDSISGETVGSYSPTLGLDLD
jgi:hypothetical protein